MEEPDFSSYSLDELYDAQRHVDRQRFPDRARRIDSEVLRREAEPGLQPVVAPTLGRAPSTATALGILAIVFGVYGAGSHLEVLVYPWTVSQQREFVKQATETLSDGTAEAKGTDGLLRSAIESVQQLSDPPSWYTSYSIAAGSFGLLTVAAYVIGGACLIRRTYLGLVLCIAACSVSIILAILKSFVFHFSFGFPLLLLLPGAILRMVFDGGLLAAILWADKRALIGR